MNTFETLLRVKHIRLCLFAVASALLMSPVASPLLNVQAAISDAMPDSFPAEIVADWRDQDGANEANAIARIKAAFPEIADKITASGEEGYLQACHWRRVARMKNYPELERIMFMRHHNFGGITVGYHDNVDAGNSDQEWESKGALCVLAMKDYYSKPADLLTRTDAVLRDPCISFDGKKVLFAMSGAKKGSGYKIYEMQIADTATVKQLTVNPDALPVVADFEPCYLPNGDIMFTSTRNFGMNSNAFTPTTNMFVMGCDGRYMRQVGFDQGHTFYPVLMDNGRVLYTRWEFNDRSTISSMGLFTMNFDGCLQTEFYGNQTSWPLSMIHARPIPGSRKVMAVAGGHHGPYAGELMIIDQSIVTNGEKGISIIAPKRQTIPTIKKTDMAMGGVSFLFQNPYPLDEEKFLVSWRKSEDEKRYRLYLMDVDGNRELLAWADQSVSQPVLIMPRKKPPQFASSVNYRDSTGTVTMENVYYGEGMKGVANGAAKSLRVVKLHYRVFGGTTGAVMGPGLSGVYTPAIICPISAYGASWDAKEVLGEAKIYDDGSAAFRVPARTPVYFQVLDSMGYCIATMRSWSTLMPGEAVYCVGCHENKTIAPPAFGPRQVYTPERLDLPLGVEQKPFDYGQMVQPIFDKHCASCHTAEHESGFDLTGDLVANSGAKKSFTRSYNSLLKGIGARDSNNAINICTIFSEPLQQPPYSFGSSKSGIMLTGGLNGNHHDVRVSETERRIVACWIDLCAPHAGKYNSYMNANDSAAYEKVMEKRLKWAEIEKKNTSGGVRCVCIDPIIPDAIDSAPLHQFVARKTGIGYLQKQHKVILNRAGEGTFLMVDLRGTVIARIKITGQATTDAVSVLLPKSLAPGLYVASFAGEHGVQQQMISVVR